MDAPLLDARPARPPADATPRERALLLLAEAGALLHASLDPEATLSSVAQLVVPALADWCAIDLADDPPRRVAVAHVDPEKVRFAEEVRRRWPDDPDAPHGVHHVLSTGETEWMGEIPEALLVASARDPEHLEVIRALGLRSYICVPLVARERVLGALSLVNAESGRLFTAGDVALAEDLARRAALAIDNARLFTEAEAARALAEQNADRVRLALDAGRFGPWEWDVAAGRVWWSPAIEAMHGIPEGSFDGTFEGYARDIHPEDRDRLFAGIESLLREGTHHFVRYRIVRPDGQTRWLEAHGRLYRDAAGRPVKLIGVCGDVTEKLLAEKEARRLERERCASHAYALRAEIAEALTTRGDLATVMTRCVEALTSRLGLVAAALWVAEPEGYALIAQAGAPIDGAFARLPFDAGPFRGILDPDGPLVSEGAGDPRLEGRPLPAGASWLGGLRLGHGDQRAGVLGLFAERPLSEDLVGVLSLAAEAIVQSIDRLRAKATLAAYAQELARSNAELQQFAYVASHDLQEPLRMVASYTQLLARRYRGRLDADADDFIAFAVDGVTRMQTLINDLLAYSRVGTRAREPVEVETERVVADVLANLRTELERTGTRTHVGRLPRVRGDAGQLGQLFQNLVANAVKFRGEAPPEVHIDAEPGDGEWTFVVRDNGIGIAPEFHERVFIIFQRLHTRDESPGNGIGLAICKKIVERHGGRIWIESGPGTGAAFHFTLPATAQ